MGNGVLPAELPVQEVLLELLIGDLDPVFAELFPFLPRRERRLGVVAFDLSDVDLLAGRVHEEVDGVQHAQLERQLLVFLDVVVSILLGAVADLLGRPMGAVGQKISDSLASDDPVQQPEEPLLVVGGHSGEVIVGQDAGFIQLESEGHDLRGCESVHSILGRTLCDPQTELQIRHGRHRVGELGEALHHVGGKPGDGNRRPAFQRAVVAADEPRPHAPHGVGPLPLDLLGPETFSARSGVAPGKVLGVPLLIVDRHLLRRAEPGQDGHDPGDRVLLSVFDVPHHLVAHLDELSRAGDIDVVGSANGDRLEALVSHDGADSAAAGTGPALLDGREPDPVFAGQADGCDLDFGIIQLCSDHLRTFERALALEMCGIAYLHFVVVYPQVDEVRRFAANDQLVIPRILQLRREEAAHH